MSRIDVKTVQQVCHQVADILLAKAQQPHAEQDCAQPLRHFENGDGAQALAM